MKARYPIKVGTVLMPKGEPCRRATLEEARAMHCESLLVWPEIEYKEGSIQIAVVFRDLPPIIVHKDQIDD